MLLWLSMEASRNVDAGVREASGVLVPSGVLAFTLGVVRLDVGVGARDDRHHGAGEKMPPMNDAPAGFVLRATTNQRHWMNSRGGCHDSLG